MPTVSETPSFRGRRNRKWTDEEVAKLKVLYDAGMPGRDIAKALNRPQTAIYAKVKHVGIELRGIDNQGTTDRLRGRKNFWNIERTAELARLWDEFRPMEEIAILLGTTESAVRIKAYYLGLRRPADVTADLKWVPTEIAAVLRENGVDAFREAVRAHRAVLEEEHRTRAARADEARRANVQVMKAKHDSASMPRDVAIVFERACGSTLEEIAGRHGVTRERIRQICVQMMTRSEDWVE